MALITCKECGQQISNKATTCIHCGCPLSEMATSGTVRIRMPNNIATGWVGLFSSRRAAVMSNGKTLWEGQHGENASFVIDAPTEITIELGGWANPVEGTVYPRKKYSLIQDTGVHMLATFCLTEVDIIDAD